VLNGGVIPPFFYVIILKRGGKWCIVENNYTTTAMRMGEMMFVGKYQNSIDAKNRMIIPSKYRDELGYSCVLTVGTDKCLYIYATADWENFAKKLLELSDFDETNRSLVRHYYANASTCEIDKQGRIMIPQELREFAGIEKDLVTLGVGNKIEVWSKTVLESKGEIDPGKLAQERADRGVII